LALLKPSLFQFLALAEMFSHFLTSQIIHSNEMKGLKSVKKTIKKVFIAFYVLCTRRTRQVYPVYPTKGRFLSEFYFPTRKKVNKSVALLKCVVKWRFKFRKKFSSCFGPSPNYWDFDVAKYFVWFA